MSTAPRHTITRRRVVKAGAWSVPVVAVAAAAPAAVASTPGCTSFTTIFKLSSWSIRQNDITVTLVIVINADGSCAPGSAYDNDVTLTFTLDDSAYTGAWSGADGWSQTSGSAGTYSYTVTRLFDEPRWTSVPFSFRADRVSGVDVAPITFNLTGPDGVAGSITVF